MHTARFETARLSISVVTTSCCGVGEGGGRVGAEINKLEQVSSDHHQMSLATGGAQRVGMSTLVGARNASNEVKYRKRVDEKIKGGLVLKNELVLIGGS